jgi:hypothetical protein
MFALVPKFHTIFFKMLLNLSDPAITCIISHWQYITDKITVINVNVPAALCRVNKQINPSNYQGWHELFGTRTQKP